MNRTDNANPMKPPVLHSIREEHPLVTFSLFAYNQESFVREAIEGAFSQTYSPLEIILSDDCSTDSTFQIMEEMANAYNGPHQVKVRRQTVNEGLLNHVCAVISEMRGEIMVLAAGDDVSVSKRVEAVVAAWTPECLGLFSACDLINEDGRTLEENWLSAEGARTRLPWLRKVQSDLFVYGASSAYHRSILEKLPRSVSKVHSEDTPLNLLVQLNSGEIQLCPNALVKYRIHGGTISNSNLSLRPSFHDLMRAEKGHAKKIMVQRDILAYLHNSLVPSANGDEWVDLQAIQSEIAFCDLRLNWYSGGLLRRARITLKMTGRKRLWALSRLLGLNFYVVLRYLLARLWLKKHQSQGIKT